MKAIRQYNDLDITARLSNQENQALDPTLCSNIQVYLVCRSERFYIQDLELEPEGFIKFRFKAEDQKKLGTYTITITALTEDGRTFTTDVCNAFNLVACSCSAGDDAGEVNIETVEVDATFEISAWGIIDLTKLTARVADLEKNKQDVLVSEKNIKTINNQSILGEGNITIEGGSGGSVTPKITDTLNVTSVDAIKQAQAKLTSTYDAAFFLITDSRGQLPSKAQEAVHVSSECIRQLSLSSPNPSVQAIIGNVSLDVKSRGMNVGDIIALARVPVSIDALASYIGLSSAVVTALKLLGVSSIEVYQYKIWVTTSTKRKNFRNTDDTVVPEGVEGLMSIYDKELVDKVPNLENIAKANDLATKYGYGTYFDDCLTTGVCAYSPANIGGVTENFTLVVQASSTVDSGGFYSIIQTAYGRTGSVYNRVFKRMIFYNPTTGTKEFHDWVEISTSAYVDKAIYSVLNTEV